MSSFKTIARHIHKRDDILKIMESSVSMGSLFNVETDISHERVSKYKGLFEGIGNTPVERIDLGNQNRLFLKLECENNRGESHYSRYWIPYLFIAETLGLIVPGETHLLEVTSGSAGIALAEAAIKLDYELTLIIPEMLPDARVNPMLEYGANVIKVPGYIDQCIDKLIEMNIYGDYFLTNHSEERANIIIDVFRRIALEYVTDYPKIDFAVIGLGNGASTEAVFRVFKSTSPGTKRICFHPSLDDYQTVFGLYGPNVELRHVDVAKSLSHEVFEIDQYRLDQLKNSPLIEEYYQVYGDSTLIGLAICCEISKTVKGKTFFSIAYDKRERYEN